MYKILPAEWEKQDAILIAWPDIHTDWKDILNEVEKLYLSIVKEISEYEKVIIITLKPIILKKLFSKQKINIKNIIFIEVPYNDTWARDFGPITIKNDNGFEILDFTFNGWGLKFASNFDNTITRNIAQKGIFNSPVKTLNFVLEGGSIETNGKGIILTTENCLLSPNRNPEFSKEEIEEKLKFYLGAEEVIFLKYGHLIGDDTDSHIDTLARFVNENTIVYVSPPEDQKDPHYNDLKLMEEELSSLKDRFNIIPLPFPRAIFNKKERLPATYANFLITNESILLPIYNDKNDNLAIEILESIFTKKKIVPINSIPLIKQHGSIHCITMQLPQGVLNI